MRTIPITLHARKGEEAVGFVVPSDPGAFKVYCFELNLAVSVYKDSKGHFLCTRENRSVEAELLHEISEQVEAIEKSASAYSRW